MIDLPPINPKSGYTKDAIIRILPNVLSADQLQLIGQISVLWNSAQYRLQYLIWNAAKWSMNTGELVTADMTPTTMVGLANNIVLRNVNHRATIEYAKATISLFNEVRISRNVVIHGLPVIKDDGSVETFQSKSAKRATGSLKVSTSAVKKSDLEQLVSDTSVLILAIEGAIAQTFVLKLTEMHHVSAVHLDENIERSALIELTHIQSRLEALSLRRSIENNNQQRPRSSEE